jgi:hypothetical protein
LHCHDLCLLLDTVLRPAVQVLVCVTLHLDRSKVQGTEVCQPQKLARGAHLAFGYQNRRVYQTCQRVKRAIKLAEHCTLFYTCKNFIKTRVIIVDRFSYHENLSVQLQMCPRNTTVSALRMTPGQLVWCPTCYMFH